jgi:hypothetical protein
MATGGTLAPSQGPRQSAAAVALGAPKGVSRAKAPGKVPGGGRYLNKASGKMESAQQIKDYRAPANPHPSRAIGAQAVPAARPPSRGQTVFNPAEHQYNEAQLTHLGTVQAQNQQQAELGQYGRQAGEVSGQEQAVQKAYGGIANTTNTLLGTLAGQSAEGAKTAENQAADAALQAGKSVETAGQNAASLTAGYLSPEVKAQLQSESARAGATGQAGTSLAANLGQNENNYMANMRAAAAQKATEGSSQIAGTYGKQLGLIRGKEAEATAKVVPNSLKFANELGQKQFTDIITKGGLNLKQNTLEQKAGETAAKNKVTERGQNLAVQRNRENATQRETASERSAHQKEAASERSAASKIKAAAEKRTGKGSTAAQDKIFSELGSAASRIASFRSGKKPLNDQAIREAISSGQFKEGYSVKNSKTGKVEQKVRINHQKAIGNQVIVQAALEAWNTHTISKQTRNELKAQGYEPGNDAEVVAELFGPQPPPEKASPLVSPAVRKG